MSVPKRRKGSSFQSEKSAQAEGKNITVLEFSGVIAAVSVAAGFLGSLTGLGGGIVIVPLLTLCFGVDIHYAMGASLVSVLATSSGAAAAYAKSGYANFRVGLFLEIAATAGALAGTFITTMIAPSFVAVIFGIVLMHSSYLSILRPPHSEDKSALDRIAGFLRLSGDYPSDQGIRRYTVRSVPLGFAIMALAGVLSGLLGIGSGALKVVGMDRIMKIPLKASTATSNFMIGITAAAGAGVYLHRGFIDPGLSMPVMLGVIGGSLIGARFLKTLATNKVRLIFAITIAMIGVGMMYKGLAGKF
jgi:uncharacterized protein